MPIPDPKIKEIVDFIRAKPKYSTVHEELVASITVDELGKGRKNKEIVKSVCAKLHQVGAVYFDRKPDYEGWLEKLKALPGNIHNPEVKIFCREVMKIHSSTRERLPILEEFFQRTLASIAPVTNILDLACGLNPLALAWMPVSENIEYHGCDIFIDMTEFLNQFFRQTEQSGRFEPCNLTQMNFRQKGQVAFLLKTLPCLEQLEKGINALLLEKIPAEAILISYPVRSLGGRTKGMGKTYEAQFNELVEGRCWKIQRFEFSSELAFLVRK